MTSQKISLSLFVIFVVHCVLGALNDETHGIPRKVNPEPSVVPTLEKENYMDFRAPPRSVEVHQNVGQMRTCYMFVLKDEDDIRTLNRTNVKKGTQPRFSIENARQKIEHVSAMPVDLKNYTLHKNETGVYSDWHENEISLEMISRLLTQGIKFVLTNSLLETQETFLVRAIVEDFISRVKKRFESVAKPLRRYPWGKNWYGFSVDLPTMLGYYLLLPQPALRSDAEALINMIITNPALSLNHHQWGPNSVYMAGAWILVKLSEGDVEQAANTTEYQNTIEYDKMIIKTLPNEEGLHRDHTFIFHKCGVFFHYFESLLIDDSVRLWYALDSEVQPPTRQWAEIASIIFHPTIAYGNIGLLGRVEQLSYETNPKSEYGVKVMPFSGYLRYFTKNGQFNVRGQKAHLAFYEPDATVKDLGQYWVQYRCVHRANTNYTIQFPAPGLIVQEGERNLTCMPAPGYKGCARTYLPKFARSFVMAYGNAGFLYQEYEIDQFGQYSVREFIEINTNAETVRITVEITSNETEKNLVYYSPTYWDDHNQDNFSVTVRPGETKLVCAVLGMEDVRENVRVNDPAPIKFPIRIGNLTIKEFEAAKSFILFDGARPVVCTPYEWSIEGDTMEVKLNVSDSNYTTFTFSSPANQYTCSASVCLSFGPFAIFVLGVLILGMQRVLASSLE